MGDWLKGSPSGTDAANTIDTLIQNNNDNLDQLLLRYKRGCEISYASAATVTIGIGEIATHNSDNSVIKFRRLKTATTVNMPTDLSAGSEANSTWYYIFADGDVSETGISKGKLSTSYTSPSGVVSYALCGAVRNDSSGDFISFTRDGNFVLYNVPQSATTDNSEHVWKTLDLSAFVPVGISNTVLLGISALRTKGSGNRIVQALVRPNGSTWSTDLAAGLYHEGTHDSTGGEDEAGLAGQLTIQTDSDGSIQYYTHDVSDSFEIVVLGYWENIGR